MYEYSCGLKKLIKEYKEETGKDHDGLMCHVVAPTEEFVEWLAKRIEETHTIKKELKNE
jgi:hypothetical protein